MKSIYFRLGSSALLLALVASCSPMGQRADPTPTASSYADATATRDANLALGNPSGAVTDATNSPNNYLLTKTQYTMSYWGGPVKTGSRLR